MGILAFKEHHFDAYESTLGELYADVRKERKPAILYIAIFCLRRLAFVASIFMMAEYPLLQQFTFCLLNFAYLIYLISVRPLEIPGANNLEIFNESMILGVNYHLFLFHFFTDDPVSAYNVGWSCIGITLIMMLVNIIVVLVKTFIDVKFALKKLIFRLRNRSKARNKGLFDASNTSR